MPQNELLDMIFDCFKKYTYWPLKTLKSEVNQPEAYLKQTLELVAHFIKGGKYAMTWQLKPDVQFKAGEAEMYGRAKDEVAPGSSYGLDGASDVGEMEGAGSEEDDDENVKMEDVILL